MQDYILKNCIACTDISDTIIYKNYKFSLFLSEYPIFLLKPNKETSEYHFTSRNNTTITIRNAKYGRATMKDADLLLYCISKLHQLDYEKKPFTRRISFTVYDYLKKTGKTIAGPNYSQVIKGLQRLASTVLETNKTISRLKIGGGRGLIEDFFCHRDKGGRLEKVEILLPEWLFAEIMLRKIITINPEYLQLKPLEKKLYQLAKTHCRNNLPGIEFSLDYFIKKVGSLEILRNFKSRMRKLQNSQFLPDFSINYEFIRDKIWFTLRKHNQDQDDVIKTAKDKVENKELKQQNVLRQNTLQIITQKFTANQNVTRLQSKAEIKKQVAYTLRELDRLYPLKKEAIFRSDVLTKSKIYSYIKEFGPQALLKAIKQHADFDFSAVDNPGGYFWKILKNSRK